MTIRRRTDVPRATEIECGLREQARQPNEQLSRIREELNSLSARLDRNHLATLAARESCRYCELREQDEIMKAHEESLRECIESRERSNLQPREDIDTRQARDVPAEPSWREEHRLKDIKARNLKARSDNLLEDIYLESACGRACLQPLVDVVTGEEIPGFPATNAEISSMTGPELDAVLRALGVPTTGSDADKRMNFRCAIGTHHWLPM